MSKRLFTFGCSYTRYQYPTWADFLGLEFEHFENWGLPGIGCRAIFERVTECHASRQITKDDIVIVQWSTHLRHDFYTPSVIDGRTTPNWKTWGSVFSEKNQKLYDKKWLDTFFFEPAYVMHSLNFIYATQLLLEAIGCQWYMTGSTEKKIYSISIEKTFPELGFYLKPIWEDRKHKWIEPIALAANELPNDWWWFRSVKDKEPWREQHPSPTQYVYWLNKYLRPKLSLGDAPSAQQSWVRQLEQIKIDCKDDRDKMDEVFTGKTKQLDFWPVDLWPRQYAGFY
jgi:hypothetical protein